MKDFIQNNKNLGSHWLVNEHTYVEAVLGVVFRTGYENTPLILKPVRGFFY